MKEIIGIDAGGSKTRVIYGSVVEALQMEFKLIRESHFDSYNYRHHGIVGLNKLIKQILGRLKIRYIESTLLLAGFAGAGTPKSHTDIQVIFEKHGFPGNLTSITSDADLLLRAIGNEGLVLTAGTGSICLGRRPISEDGSETNVRVGGYGFRTYSEPGGYQLGVRAIDAALKIEDGRGQDPTVLYTRIKDYFGVSRLEEIISLIYPLPARKSNANSRIAGIAKVVLKAANEGDEVAIHLVTVLVDNFADHIKAVYSKLGLKSPLVGLHGGLFSDPYGEKLLIGPLRQHPLLRDCELQFITLGVKEGDMDPLIEAMKHTILRKRR